MTLREMVEHLSEVTEKIFNLRGQVLPNWHIIDRDGKLIMMPAPEGVDKNTSAMLMRAFLELVGATRCVFIDEAWQVTATMKDADKAQAEARAGRLEQYPGRIEIVMFQAEDASEQGFTGQRVIIREPGKKPRLGGLEYKGEWTRSEGRFVGMLPRPPGTKTQ